MSSTLSRPARRPPQLVQCLGCHHHFFPPVEACPHCNASMQALEARRDAQLDEAEAAIAQLEAMLGLTETND